MSLDERLADVVDQAGGLDREVGDAVERVEDGLAVLLEPGDQVLEADDQPAELLVAVGDVVEDEGEVLEQVADDLVAVGERLRERRRAAEQALDGAALALEHLHDLVGQLVDVVGRQRLEERLEAVEQHGQVERRLGLRDRDGVALPQLGRRPCPRG